MRIRFAPRTISYCPTKRRHIRNALKLLHTDTFCANTKHTQHSKVLGIRLRPFCAVACTRKTSAHEAHLKQSNCYANGVVLYIEVCVCVSLVCLTMCECLSECVLMACNLSETVYNLLARIKTCALCFFRLWRRVMG